MRVWIYGGSPAQVQTIIDAHSRSSDTVIGASVCAADDTEFPQSGLTQALYSAMRGEIDQLVISDYRLLGSDTQAEQIVELFCGYGVSIRSASNCGISSS